MQGGRAATKAVLPHRAKSTQNCRKRPVNDAGRQGRNQSGAAAPGKIDAELPQTAR
jgi:hypothetical protein